MKRQELHFSVQEPFGNLYRPVGVLLVAEDAKGKIVLGTKPHYPPGLARLIGGGPEDGELPVEAARRELREEIGAIVTADALEPLVVFEVSATDQSGREFRHETHLYYHKLADQNVVAGDDITSIVTLTPDELDALGSTYDNLPPTLWHQGPDGAYSWADYGKLYGPIHHAAAHFAAERAATAT